MRQNDNELLKEVLKLEQGVKDLTSIYESGLDDIHDQCSKRGYDVETQFFEYEMDEALGNIFKYLDHIVTMIDDSY